MNVDGDLRSQEQETLISRSFFQNDPLHCSRALIGCELTWGPVSGIIVETEAYAAVGDEAAHTFFRPSTRRFIEEHSPGTLYVYLNYGVHWLLNFQVGDLSERGFVLIRALQPRCGLELMKKRRGTLDEKQLCSGPGKLTQALAIDGSLHGQNFFSLKSRCTLRKPMMLPEIEISKRIGISRSIDHEWRFTLKGSLFISKLSSKSAFGSKPKNPPQ